MNSYFNYPNLYQSMTTYIEVTYNWLCMEFPDFHTLDLASESTLIVGKPQAGKSEFTFGIALMAYLHNKIPIMLLRNFTRDAIQMQSKIRRFSLRHAKYMHKLGFKDEPILTSLLANSPEQKLINALTNQKKLILAIYNGYQLNMLNKLVPDIDFILLVDEADAIAYGDLKEEDDRPIYHAPKEYQLLAAQAQQIYEISATVFDILHGNIALTNQDIVIVHPPPTYKGIRDGVQFIPFTHKVTKWNVATDIHQADPNIIPIYTNLTQTLPFSSQRYNCPIDHPIIILHKSHVWQKHHDIFLQSFRQTEQFQQKWTVIIEDSRALQLYNWNFKGQSVTIAGEKATDKSKRGIFIFLSKNIDVPTLLQWLIDQGGAEKFAHILIKTGRQAGRSRSYVSTDGTWHLTHEYYSPAPNGRNIADLIQAVRLCHNRPDSIPLLLYAPEIVCKTLQKADILQDEQLQRLRELTVSIPTNEYIQADVWTKGKIPKYKLCKSKINKSLQLIPTELDGGWSMDKYTPRLVVPDGKYVVVEQNKFQVSSTVYKMIADVEKILIDQNKMNQDVEIVWVNNQLLTIANWAGKNLDGIHGALWTPIRKNRSLIRVDTKIPHSLLYWKQGVNCFVCLT